MTNNIFPENMFPKETWEEYEKRMGYYKDIIIIKKLLDEHPELHGLTGGQLQEEFDHTLYGVDIKLSWRGWGALMSAYMNSKEGKRKYNYMSFYM